MRIAAIVGLASLTIHTAALSQPESGQPDWIGGTMLVASGCAQVSSTEHPVTGQSPASETSPEGGRIPTTLADSLLGSWKLVSVGGESVPDTQLTITLSPQFFDARVNCNRVSGYYSLRATSFVPNRAVASERGCGPRFTFDTFLTRTLQFGMNLAMPEGDHLVAEAGDRKLVFVRTSLR